MGQWALGNAPKLPNYDEQLARLSDLNAYLKQRRDIDALLDQFCENQLSSVLEFCLSISSINRN